MYSFCGSGDKFKHILFHQFNKVHFPWMVVVVELSYDPAIPLLGICIDKTIIKKDTCSPMFTAALFTIAKTWKQTQRPLTDEWIKKMSRARVCVCVCVQDMETNPTSTDRWMDKEDVVCVCVCVCVHYLAIKELNNAIGSNTDTTRDYHTK